MATSNTYQRVDLWLKPEEIARLDSLARQLYPYQPTRKRSEIIRRILLSARVKDGLLVVDEMPALQAARE